MLILIIFSASHNETPATIRRPRGLESSCHMGSMFYCQHKSTGAVRLHDASLTRETCVKRLVDWVYSRGATAGRDGGIPRMCPKGQATKRMLLPPRNRFRIVGKCLKRLHSYLEFADAPSLPHVSHTHRALIAFSATFEERHSSQLLLGTPLHLCYSMVGWSEGLFSDSTLAHFLQSASAKPLESHELAFPCSSCTLAAILEYHRSEPVPRTLGSSDRHN